MEDRRVEKSQRECPTQTVIVKWWTVVLSTYEYEDPFLTNNNNNNNNNKGDTSNNKGNWDYFKDI